LIQNADAAIALVRLKLAAIENHGFHRAEVIRGDLVVSHVGILERIWAAADSLKSGCRLEARHRR
jgi:hypothetical protein